MKKQNERNNSFADARQQAIEAVPVRFRLTAERILSEAASYYGNEAPLLCRILKDVADLFEGRWPSHEACQVRYHNFGHTLDVSLSTLRMIIGKNSKSGRKTIAGQHFLAAMTAAFFHDSGYIKDKGDMEGRGGKYTFTHVERGMEIASEYLHRQGSSAPDPDLVQRIISVTDYQKKNTDLGIIFPEEQEMILAQMVVCSDLVAQMADTSYMLRINDLFDEFSEVYAFETTDALKEKGAKVYSSAEEIIEGTITFYEQFVLPLLERFGRMDRYLASFFKNGRNPYMENIAANLSRHALSTDSQWRRLGQILNDLGMVTPEKLSMALDRQRSALGGGAFRPGELQASLFSWMNTPSPVNTLGEILLEMKAVGPDALGRALLSQLLPESLVAKISSDELFSLLESALLLQNVSRGRWLFIQVMDIIAATLGSRRAFILLADPENQGALRLFCSSSDAQPAAEKNYYIDKGLDGWVFTNARPSVLNDTDQQSDSVSADKKGSGRILAVPLYGNGRVIGVIEVEDKPTKPFSEHDTHLLVVFANMISNTITEIALQQKTKNK